MTVNQARLRFRGMTLAALVIAACGAPDRSGDAPVQTPAQAVGAAATGDGALDPSELLFADETAPPGDSDAARVGGTVITIDDVRREAGARELVDDPDVLHPASPVFRRTLQDLIDQRLLALEAARLDLQNDPEARRRLAAAQERILGNILVETAVSDAVSEEAVQRVFEEQRRLAPAEIELRARHILVETREEAVEVARLVAEGADFAQLAARVSQDPATRFEGGDLGYFTREGILPAFADVAFTTDRGAVSAPFQTEYGWHVLTVTDRRRQPQPGLDERRGDIVRFLTLQGIDALLSDIRETYPVSIQAGAAPQGLRGEPAPTESELEPGAPEDNPDDPAPADPGGGER